MKVTNEYGNLVYDEENQDCSIEFCQSQGKVYAFITALDYGISHTPRILPLQKQYWGEYNLNKQQDSIREILHNGGKWPLLTNRVEWD